MGPWWLTWHLCLYICEKCEMSRLWHTDTRTDEQWKVVQYSVWAESAFVIWSASLTFLFFKSILRSSNSVSEVFLLRESFDPYIPKNFSFQMFPCFSFSVLDLRLKPKFSFSKCFFSSTSHFVVYIFLLQTEMSSEHSDMYYVLKYSIYKQSLRNQI